MRNINISKINIIINITVIVNTKNNIIIIILVLLVYN